MKFIRSTLLAAGLCLCALAGCGGDDSAAKPEVKTEPYREVGAPKGNPPPMKKDGKVVGFQ